MIENAKIQRPRLVLVVDDQKINRDILGFILEDHYEVAYAENGAEALDIMYQRIDDLSLVMLDLMMPVMDGFTVMEKVKADERLRTVPIIVLTAEKTAELKALQMGASDFITKPFDVPEVILARASRIIELNDGRQLISAAETDRLTGLYTRNFFVEYAERLHQYHPELHMDAVVLNIEQFHTVNALNGRDFGDQVLAAVGAAIRKFLGETEGIACRLEGDRYYIYCLPQPDYKALLDRFQNETNALTDKVNIHLRMGVKPWEEGAAPVEMFDRARAACNLVRGDYQNSLKICDQAMIRKELLDRRLLNDLAPAVAGNQFQVYYQPKYDIQCEPPRLASAEALIRWQHPELGMISPGQFVPLFEGNGLIGVVDSFVWRTAAAQVADWKARYGVTVPVSVNLSRSDVYDPTVVQRLQHLRWDNGLDADSIKLEVTESAYTDNAKQMLDVIHRLRHLGFQVEMDDFGSGYSSLNMLSSMPIDILKMDMSFVRHIEDSETDMRLVMLILDIARALDLKVVAEGVETAGQLKLLKDAGCDLVQGYYFSKPVPAAEFEKLIEKELQIERG